MHAACWLIQIVSQPNYILTIPFKFITSSFRLYLHHVNKITYYHTALYNNRRYKIFRHLLSAARKILHAYLITVPLETSTCSTQCKWSFAFDANTAYLPSPTNDWPSSHLKTWIITELACLPITTSVAITTPIRLTK